MSTIRKKHNAAARARRGTSTVEFAAVAPVAFILIFGTVEFGRLMMVRHAMTNASREAAREASLASTISSSDVDSLARQFMDGVVSNASNAQKVRVTMSPASLSNVSSGTPVTVSIAINFSDIGWLPTGLMNLTGNPALSASSTYYRE